MNHVFTESGEPLLVSEKAIKHFNLTPHQTVDHKTTWDILSFHRQEYRRAIEKRKALAIALENSRK